MTNQKQDEIPLRCRLRWDAAMGSYRVSVPNLEEAMLREDRVTKADHDAALAALRGTRAYKRFLEISDYTLCDEVVVAILESALGVS